MEDLKIIQLYWEREESAIIQTKEKYGKTMEQLAYRLLFDYQDTEECCSDTYWDLWNALPPNRPIHFKAFIMRICRCNAMNRLERREAIPDETFQKTSEGELTMYIQDYLRSLPSDKRILFVRRYWYGDSIKELAVMFCMTQSSVKVSLFRMREQFKEMLVCQGVIEKNGKVDMRLEIV